MFVSEGCAGDFECLDHRYRAHTHSVSWIPPGFMPLPYSSDCGAYHTYGGVWYPLHNHCPVLCPLLQVYSRTILFTAMLTQDEYWCSNRPAPNILFHPSEYHICTELLNFPKKDQASVPRYPTMVRKKRVNWLLVYITTASQFAAYC